MRIYIYILESAYALKRAFDSRLRRPIARWPQPIELTNTKHLQHSVSAGIASCFNGNFSGCSPHDFRNSCEDSNASAFCLAFQFHKLLQSSGALPMTFIHAIICQKALREENNTQQHRKHHAGHSVVLQLVTTVQKPLLGAHYIVTESAPCETLITLFFSMPPRQ